MVGAGCEIQINAIAHQQKVLAFSVGKNRSSFAIGLNVFDDWWQFEILSWKRRLDSQNCFPEIFARSLNVLTLRFGSDVPNIRMLHVWPATLLHRVGHFSRPGYVALFFLVDALILSLTRISASSEDNILET